SALAVGHFAGEEYVEAAERAERAARLAPQLISNHLIVAASRALSGDLVAARRAAAEVQRISAFSAAPLRHVLSSSTPDLRTRFFHGLTLAGLDVAAAS